MSVAVRLPQVPRPGVEPTVGSKSSKARAERALAVQASVTKRDARYAELFGDALGAAAPSKK
eukprot:8157076-Pyramimonas_sp.AAC.1